MAIKDVEQLIARVWNPDVRPVVVEAWGCYGTGAYRACIALAWAAVSADLIAKLTRLADEGEGEAIPVAKKIESAREVGIAPVGIKLMQEVERDLLSEAVKVELLDEISARDLNRLREDRHLCVHPSLGGFGEAYSPSAEYARAHLTAALDGSLIHPPSQGRIAIDRFQSFINDERFVADSDHISQSFYQRVRPAVRRRIIELAAKHSLLELATSQDPPGDQVIANRMFLCLSVFATQDRAAVRDSIVKIVDRIGNLNGDTLLRVLSRAGELDALWDAMRDSEIGRIRQLIADTQLPPGSYPWEEISPLQADLFSLVGVPLARTTLPELVGRFAATSSTARATIMARRIDPYFVPFIPELLESASSFRTAESVTQEVVIPYGPLIDTETLDSILQKWSSNDQCRKANMMLSNAVELYTATSHLRDRDGAIWESFIERVRVVEPEGSYHRYDLLESALRT